MKKIYFFFFLFFTSCYCFAFDFGLVESFELYPVQFDKNVNVISEKVKIHDLKTEIEMELSSLNKKQEEIVCTIVCEPKGYGRSYTDMLIPYGLEIFFDDKPVNCFVLYDNKKYNREDANKTKGYLKSEIKFTIKLRKNNKLKINLFNRSYSSNVLNYGQRYVYMNYRFVTDTSKKEIFFENTNEDTLIYKVLYKQTDNNIECCDASRIKDNDTVYWKFIVPNDLEFIIFCLDEYNLDLIDSTIDFRSYDESIDYHNDLLTIKNLYFLSMNQLAILRNSIYAARGYGFKTVKWIKYFTENFFGYEINPNFSESDFNEIEKKNIELIRYMENTMDPLLLSDYFDSDYFELEE
ncbi:MAG: YARHG domain-containing protein [Treponema sp.]|nr:YARHG domain-containing protein [Treponema sp.]